MQLVEYNLSLHLHDNAIFLAERLVDAAPTETNRHLLATAYVHAGRHRQAVTALHGCTSTFNKYLLARSLIAVGKGDEADEQLIAAAGLAGLSSEEQVAALQRDPYRVPHGAAGAHLLAQANQLAGRNERAAKFWMLALYLDPFQFAAYEALCRMGYMPEPSQSFITRRLAPDGGLSAHATARESESNRIAAEARAAEAAAAAVAAAAAAANAGLAGRKRAAGLEPPASAAAASGGSVAAAADGFTGVVVPTPMMSPITPAARLLLTGALAGGSAVAGSGHYGPAGGSVGRFPPHSAAEGDYSNVSGIAGGGGASGANSSYGAANYSSLSGSMLMLSGVAPASAASAPPPVRRAGAGGGVVGSAMPQPHFGDTPAADGSDASDGDSRDDHLPAAGSPGVFDVSAISAGSGVMGGGGGGTQLFFQTYRSTAGGTAAAADGTPAAGAADGGASGSLVTPVSTDVSSAVPPASAATAASAPAHPMAVRTAAAAVGGGLPPTAAAPRRQQRRAAPPSSAAGAESATAAYTGVAASPLGHIGADAGSSGGGGGAVLNFDSAPRTRPLEQVHPAFRGMALPAAGTPGASDDGGYSDGGGGGNVSLLSPVPHEHQTVPTRLMNRLLGASLSMSTPAPTWEPAASARPPPAAPRDGAGAGGDGYDDGGVHATPAAAELSGDAATSDSASRASAFLTPATLLQRRLMMARRAATLASGELSSVRPPPARGRGAGVGRATPASAVPAFKLPPDSVGAASSGESSAMEEEDDDGGGADASRGAPMEVTTAAASPASPDYGDGDAGADGTPAVGGGAGGGSYTGPVGPAAIIMAHKAKRPRPRLPASGGVPPSGAPPGTEAPGTAAAAGGGGAGGIAWGAATRRATRLDFGATAAPPSATAGGGGGDAEGDVANVATAFTPGKPVAPGAVRRGAAAAAAATATAAPGGSPPAAPSTAARGRSVAFASPTGSSAGTPAADVTAQQQLLQPPPAKPALAARLQEGGAAVLAMLTQFGFATRHLYRYEGQHVLTFLDDHLSPPSLAKSGFALMLRGRACCDAGDFRGARDAFRRMRLAQPERLAGLEYLSTALWHLRATTELAALAHELTAYAPDAWQTWVAVGNAYSAQRDHAGALRAFRKAIALDGAREAYPHSLAGHELLALGRLDEAMESFRTATHREGRAYHAWHGIGVVYFKQGDLPRAELHFRKASDINKRSASVLVYLAMALAGQPGKEDEALATLARASCVDPTNPQAMYQRGLLLLARKRPAEAVAELQAAREAAPAEPGVLVTLGKALRAAGRLNDAVEAWNAALALTRSDKDAVLIRNLLATAQGPPSDADDLLIF